MRHSEKGLFQVLEKILRERAEPMDCVQLFDIPEVKEFAATPNRVSDYLGGLWRKGMVTRSIAPDIGRSRSRYMYQWKTGELVSETDYRPRLLVDRPSVVITEEGKTMFITTPHLTIMIKQT